MSFVFLTVLPWILFGVLFVIATLVALGMRASGRKVSRDDVLLLLTKSIGSLLMALFAALIGVAVLDRYAELPPWLTTGLATLLAMTAAALTWKLGRARIR